MKLPNLSRIPPNPTPVHKLITKDEFKELIWKNHGIITLCCAELSISYPQFYRALHKWELEDELKKAKEAFISAAEATLFESLQSKSEGTRLKAADAILKYSTPRHTQEITIKSGDVETSVKSIFGVE